MRPFRPVGPTMLACLMVLLGCLTHVHAQSTVTLSGVVSDAAGTPIRSATVTASGPAPTRSRSVQTDASGRYIIQDLTSETYVIEVHWSGTAARRTVALASGHHQHDFILNIGQLAESVTITAHKREESLDRAPVAVDVLPGDRLAQAGIVDVAQIGAYVPNLRITNAGGRASINFLALRGFINTPAAIDPSMALYVDGVPVTDFYSTSQSLTDVEQVEVIKGPQSTLYGANSQAGVITIRSRRPTNDWRGEARVDAGTFGTVVPSASVSGPLVPNRLFLGVAGTVHHRGGFIRNVVTGVRYDTQEGWDGRGRVFWTPSARWEVSGTVSRRVIDDHGGYIYLPNDIAAFNALPSLGGYRVGDFEQALDLEGANASTSTAASGQATYHGRVVDVVYTSAWRENVQSYSFDADLSPTPIFGAKTSFDVRNDYHELRLQSPSTAASRLTWTSGLSLQRENRHGNSFLIAGSANPFGLPAAEYPAGAYDLSRHFVGVYGQATLRTPSRRVGITGGLRYDRVGGTLDREQSAFAGYPEQLEDFDNDIWLPKVGVDVRLSSSTLLYGSLGRGWKSGGLSPYASTIEQSRFGRESSWTYEGGVRVTQPARGIVANAAVFLNRISDFHDSLRQGIFSYLGNAERATSYGVDLDATLTPARGWRLGAGLGITRLYYDRYLFDAGNDVRFDGRRVPQVPSYNGSAQASYEFPTGVYLRGDAVFTGPFVDRLYIPPAPGSTPSISEFELDAAHVYNVAAGVARGRWTVGILVHNLADRRYLLNSENTFAFYSGYFQPVGVLGPRRVITLQLSTRF